MIAKNEEQERNFYFFFLLCVCFCYPSELRFQELRGSLIVKNRNVKVTIPPSINFLEATITF